KIATVAGSAGPAAKSGTGGVSGDIPQPHRTLAKSERSVRGRERAPAVLRALLSRRRPLEFMSFGAHSSPASTEALPCLSQRQFPRARASFVPTAQHFIR